MFRIPRDKSGLWRRILLYASSGMGFCEALGNPLFPFMTLPLDKQNGCGRHMHHTESTEKYQNPLKPCRCKPVAHHPAEKYTQERQQRPRKPELMPGGGMEWQPVLGVGGGSQGQERQAQQRHVLHDELPEVYDWGCCGGRCDSIIDVESARSFGTIDPLNRTYRKKQRTRLATAAVNGLYI